MTIYVGIDGSDGAAEAARWAAREGELRDLPVTAVVAWDYLNQRHPKDGAEEFDPAYSEDDALSVLDKWVTSAVGAERADTVERVSVCDLPWRALVTISQDADLLVVGARGSGGFLGLRIGSVSEHVLQQAHCPVAVVHADGRAASCRPKSGSSSGSTDRRPRTRRWRGPSTRLGRGTPRFGWCRRGPSRSWRTPE